MLMRDNVIDHETHEPCAPRLEPAADAATRAMLVNALDELDCGVMLIDADARVLHTNAAARTELNEASRIQIRNARLAAVSLRNTSAIEEAVRDAAKGLQRFVRITSSKADLTLAFTPLRETQDAAHPAAHGTRAVLVMIGKQEPSNPVVLAAFAKMYRLSATEHQLLPAICDGASAKEMAQCHGTSVFTIRSHLKNIRTKASVNNLRRLVLLLMSFPPLRPR
jgi:DNA-binding CsgD family transcriptional regulator